LSVVIPAYNEEAIVERALLGYLEALRAAGRSFEIVVSCNGCTDGTVALALQLQAKHAELVVLSSPVPNYGQALRLGIEAARGRWVVCDEMDLCDTGFVSRALLRLEQGSCDFVVGSKAMPGARD